MFILFYRALGVNITSTRAATRGGQSGNWPSRSFHKRMYLYGSARSYIILPTTPPENTSWLRPWQAQSNNTRVQKCVAIADLCSSQCLGGHSKRVDIQLVGVDVQTSSSNTHIICFIFTKIFTILGAIFKYDISMLRGSREKECSV